jgi:glutathione S-transferase
VIRPFDKSGGGLFNSSQQPCLNKKPGRENTMKLYDSVGPNPRVVRMFMAEKGIEVPKQTVDLRKGENREAEHLKRNPHGQMPTLELDNGNYLSEITAICEYLEEKHPAPR